MPLEVREKLFVIESF
jgi:hypothetical protein